MLKARGGGAQWANSGGQAQIKEFSELPSHVLIQIFQCSSHVDVWTFFRKGLSQSQVFEGLLPISRFPNSNQSNKNRRGSILWGCCLLLFVVWSYVMVRDVQVSILCFREGWNVTKTEISPNLFFKYFLLCAEGLEQTLNVRAEVKSVGNIFWNHRFELIFISSS